MEEILKQERARISGAFLFEVLEREWVCDITFPLTPALSLRERVKLCHDF